MKKLLPLLLLATTFAGAARADFIQLTGPGGSIPAQGGGGGGTWQSVLPGAPFTSSIVAPNPIVQVTRIDFTGLVHGRAGDLQAVLKDPAGKRHNLFVRSGFTGVGDGNLGIFQGNIAFVTAGQPPFPGAGNIGSGLYSQDFGNSGNPPAPWTDGNLGIFNTPLSSFANLAGTWTLEIYDWEEGALGTITSWTLSGTDNQLPVTPFCFGDGTQPVSCPCGNSGAAGRGCANSSGTGAVLASTGSPSNDTMVFTSSGELPSALSILLQGGTTTGPNAVPFGDGLICVAGILKRLYVKSAVGGVATAPGPGDPSVMTRSAQLGDTIPLGATRNYQMYYRDPNATFCPTGGTFNISNGLRVVWI
jgi:hypothetical protein